MNGEHELPSESDVALIRQLSALLAEVDPVPPDLVLRSQFALALERGDAELCAMSETEELAGARGDEYGRLVTFDADSLTIMVNLRPSEGGTLRVDGWLSPPASHAIELWTAEGSMRTRSDPGGRFAVDGIPHGMTRIVVRSDDGNTTVSTPAIEL